MDAIPSPGTIVGPSFWRSTFFNPVDYSNKNIERYIAEHGSPLLVISKTRLTDNYRALTRALPQLALHYAVKSNPHPIILETLAGLGAGFDAASVAELDAILALGVTPDRIIYTNPVKPFGAIEQVLDRGLNIFVFDNPAELEKIVAKAPAAQLLLRINVTNPNCVVDLGQKFGCPPAQAEELLKRALESGLRVRGISFHVGSQTSIPQPYLDTILECRKLFNHMALAGYPMDILDIGGGFPISYRTSEMPIESFCKPIQASLEMYFPNTTVLAEPGRILSGSAATLFARVMGKRTRNGVVWYYIEDGLYGSLSGCVFDHAQYRITSNVEGPPIPCVIAGPTCDSFDIISKHEFLPELSIGDTVIIHDIGAYSSASATTFNGYPLTKIVAAP